MFVRQYQRGDDRTATLIIRPCPGHGRHRGVCVEFDRRAPFIAVQAGLWVPRRISALPADTEIDAELARHFASVEFRDAVVAHAEEQFQLPGRAGQGAAATAPDPIAVFDPLAPPTPVELRTACSGNEVTNGPVLPGMVDRLRSAGMAVITNDAQMFQQQIFEEETDDFLAAWQQGGLGNIQAALLEDGYRLEETAALFGADDCQDTATYLWYAAPGIQGDDRRQAARAWPCLAGMIANHAVLRETVDHRRPLGADLIGMFPGIGKGGLRKLGRIRHTAVEQGRLAEAFVGAADADAIGVVRQRRVALEGAWSTADAVRWLDRSGRTGTGANAVPDGAEEWNAYTTIYAGMIKPLAAHFAARTWLEAIRPPGNSWMQLLTGLGRDLGMPETPDRRSLNVAVADAIELCDALACDIVLPVVLQAIDQAPGPHHIRLPQQRSFLAARAVAGDMLVPTAAQQPLRIIAGAVRAGLTRLHRLEGIRTPDGDDSSPAAVADRAARCSRYTRKTWAAPWQDTRVNHVEIRFLESQQALAIEGRNMGHCIGSMRSYGLDCWRGRAIAAHVTDGADRATAYIRFDRKQPGGLPASIEEMHGRRNARTPPDLRRALTHFLNTANGTTPVDGIAVRDNPEYPEYQEWLDSDAAQELLAAHVRQPDRSAVDPFDLWKHDMERPNGLRVDSVAALWSVWQDILPHATKNTSPESAVWRQKSAQSLLRDLSPSVFELMNQSAPTPAGPRRMEAATATLESP